jgi:hypothetical protein
VLSRAVRARSASPPAVVQRMIRETETKSSSSSGTGATGPYRKVAVPYTAEVSASSEGFTVKLYRAATTWSFEFGKQLVGQAAVKLSDQAAVDAPQQQEIYKTEHVLGARPGRLAYLDNIKNFSVLTDEPGDIYVGVGTALIRAAEGEARRRGAAWIYLVASPTAARDDPNSAAKKTADPAGFYAKAGFVQDPVQFQHNLQVFLDLMPDADIDAVRQQARRMHEALWIKQL